MFMKKTVMESAAVLMGSMLAAADIPPELEQDFLALRQAPWQVELTDSGTSDWQTNWFVDGSNATLINAPSGWEIRPSAKPGDASHVVVWTKKSFSGDLRLEYDYTRLDHETQRVNIVYLQASGLGKAPWVADIAQWRDLRNPPAMSCYFDLMNALHVSYAAFDNSNTDPGADYVRARRYIPRGPGQNSLKGTEIAPDDYGKSGLFLPGETYHFTFIKTGTRLFFHVKGKTTERLFVWKLDSVPPLPPGRIGIRHMYGRAARYANIVISTR